MKNRLFAVPALLILVLAVFRASGAMAETAGKVRLTSGGGEAIAVLDDTPAARDFLSMLPLELTFKDYNRTEKISYLPRKLSVQGSPSSCTPEAGAFTYYAPWGNLALFYRGFRHSDGLVPLGKIVSGLETLASHSGSFAVRIEKADRAYPGLFRQPRRPVRTACRTQEKTDQAGINKE